MKNKIITQAELERRAAVRNKYARTSAVRDAAYAAEKPIMSDDDDDDDRLNDFENHDDGFGVSDYEFYGN